MATPIVRPTGPPDQDAKRVIHSWRTEGYEIALIDAGRGAAKIFCTAAGQVPLPYGRIDYNADEGRHYISWNKLAMCALERYKLDYWDTRIYSAMAADRRARAAS